MQFATDYLVYPFILVTCPAIGGRVRLRRILIQTRNNHIKETIINTYLGGLTGNATLAIFAF